MHNNGRLLYIDCLRGLAMLMVVYSHILSFSMGDIQPSPVGQLIRDIMLPLFFFISGFCAYKKNSTLSLKDFGKQIITKIKTILLPTVVMFIIFMLYSGNDITYYVFRYDKSGYWFTWVLFQILTIYLLFKVVASWVKVKQFYLYFFVGLFTHWFYPQIDRILRNNLVNASLLLISIISYLVIERGNCLIFMAILFYFIFKKLNSWFSMPNNVIAHHLSVIGQNTLPVYFIHFFLLFSIPLVPDWLMFLQHDNCFGTHSCSSIVEFAVCGGIAFFISYACIGISKIISLFPWVYKICLGPIRQ